MAVTEVKAPDGSIIKVKHPDGASPRSIIRYAKDNYNKPASNMSAPSAKPVVMPTEMSTADAFKLGLMDFAEQFIPDVFVFGKLTEEDLTRTYQEMEQERESFKRGVAGVDESAQADFGDNVIRGLSDPMNLVGSRLPTSIPNIAMTMANLTSAVTGTAAGVGVSEGLQETDLPPFAQELLTAALAPLAGVAAGGPTAAVTNTGIDAVGRYVRAISPAKAAEALANTGVESKLASIRELEGANIEERVQAFKDLQEAVPGLELPFAALADKNPIVESWLKEVSASDVEFRANLVEKLNTETAKVAEAYDKLFDAKEAVPAATLRAEMQSRLETSIAQSEKTLKTKMRGFNARENELIKKMSATVDSVTLGEKLQKTVDNKTAIVRAEADKLYDKTLIPAAKRGDMVPARAVADIYNTVSALRADDIFGAQPDILRKIERVWGPQMDEEGIPQVFDVPVSEFHSLRKATNKAISTAQGDKRQKLYALKEQLDKSLNNEIAAESPQFVSDYRKANEFYYKELGVPLRAQGMVDIDRQKFFANAAQQLTNPEKAMDYINFVGEKEALPVIRHAVRLAAESKGVVDVDGKVREGALKKFVLQNQRLIKMAQMSNEFNLGLKEIASIRDSSAKHQENFNAASKAAAEGFFKATLNMELPALVDTMLKNPSKRAKYLKEINNLDSKGKDMALRGLQQAFLDKALDSAGTMSDYVMKHQDAAIDLFGKRHVENINKLTKVTDLMNQMDQMISRAMGRVHTVDIMQQRTGVTFAEASGLLRNQVLSAERKAINFVSKAISTKAQESKENIAGKILLSTDVVEALANPPKGWDHYARSIKSGSINEVRTLAKTFADALSKVIPLQAYRGMQGAETAQEEELRNGNN